MPESLDTKKNIARLAGEVVALRALVRRMIAHIAVLDGGHLDFLRDELAIVLDELDQFAHPELNKRDQALVRERAAEVITEAFTTIDIGGRTVPPKA